jgi:drug/metabolite transporter (DMT)-like permease
MPHDPDHAAESVTAVAGEGGVAVSYVPAGTRVSARAVVLLTISSLIFSTGGLFIRELDDPQAWRTVFWRSLGACFSLVLLIIWREKQDPFRAVVRIGRPGWAVAGAFSASSIGMVVALTKTSVAIVLVIFALSPLAAAIMARIIIGERIRNYTWVAIGTTVGGVAFMVSGPGAGGSAAGALVALIIPIAFGFGTVMIRRHSEIAMAPAMLLSAVISCLIAAPFAHPFDISRHDLILLLTFGFAQLGIGLAVFSIGAAHAPATDVALLSMIEPIVGPIWVWIFVAEYPGVPALIGGSIVFVALALHTLYAASRAADQPLSTGLTVTPGATTASIAARTSGGNGTSAPVSSDVN